MSFQFRQIQLPLTPPQWQATKLKLASEKGNALTLNNLNIPKIESRLPRQIDEIIRDIQNEKPENITQLEWVYCLYGKNQWDIQNPDISTETSAAIWQVATRNNWLKQRLFCRLALYYNQKSQIENNASSLVEKENTNLSLLPISLVETFPDFASRAKGNDALPVQIIRILSEDEPAFNLAKSSWQYLRTPSELLENANLPNSLPQANQALAYIAGIFTKNQISNKPEIDWLLRCLKEMSSPQQLAALEELLSKVSLETVNRLPQLVEWLREEYSPHHNESQWHQLSEVAKSNLSRWIGTVNYGYLKTLIDLLSRMLKLSDEERQQLEEKRDFWANYSDRIQRLRLLLPQSSIDSLGYQLQIPVDILAENSSDITEVCIFDFGNYFGIEFLRGVGREMRLLPRNPNIELLLFSPSKLSVSQLRKLGGEICDRVYQWQPYCEKWLREKNILPNSGTEYFQGLPKNKGKYNSNHGLPFPEGKEQKERDSKLKQWQREMEKLNRS